MIDLSLRWQVIREIEQVLRDDGGDVFVGRHMEIRREWLEALLAEVKATRER